MKEHQGHKNSTTSILKALWWLEGGPFRLSFKPSTESVWQVTQMQQAQRSHRCS